MTYTYKTVGELPIKLDVYRLPGDDMRSVIVWIHGGALIVGQRNGPSAAQRKRYLNAGHVIVSIDYRWRPSSRASSPTCRTPSNGCAIKAPTSIKIDPTGLWRF
jgi:Carboxylesterase family